MTNDWRTLLYPLGFLASLAFSGRFIVQLIQSERRKTSHVSRVFWRLSLLGNILLLVHAFVQVQIHICLVQGANLVFSWRNLDLMNTEQRRAALSGVFLRLASVLALIVLGFVIQGHLCFGFVDWVRTPSLPWIEGPGEKLPLGWHLFGSIGIILFGARFWLQWLLAERRQTSYLGQGFWWTSLAGATIALIYFVRLNDPVNILGTGTAIIPAARNLMLLRRAKAEARRAT